jgi:hypothetical protein
MITVSHNESFIHFEYHSNLDGVDLHTFYNVIEIVDSSDDILELISIESGVIQFSEYAFPSMFITNGIEHTMSAMGQFIWLLEKFIEEIA